MGASRVSSHAREPQRGGRQPSGPAHSYPEPGPCPGRRGQRSQPPLLSDGHRARARDAAARKRAMASKMPCLPDWGTRETSPRTGKPRVHRRGARVTSLRAGEAAGPGAGSAPGRRHEPPPYFRFPRPREKRGEAEPRPEGQSAARPRPSRLSRRLGSWGAAGADGSSSRAKEGQDGGGGGFASRGGPGPAGRAVTGRAGSGSAVRRAARPAPAADASGELWPRPRPPCGPAAPEGHGGEALGAGRAARERPRPPGAAAPAGPPPPADLRRPGAGQGAQSSEQQRRRVRSVGGSGAGSLRARGWGLSPGGAPRPAPAPAFQIGPAS